MNQEPILVTGATGKTGSRIALLLEARGFSVRRASRSFEPAFDWTQPETYPAALRGCRAAYICYYPDYAFPGTAAALTAFTEAATRAGVEHLVMLVGRGEAHATKAETVVRRSGIPTTVLRSAWFAQNFSEGAMFQGVCDHVISMPGGNVREPIVDLDDLCEVASRMLIAVPGDRVLEITGPTAISFADMSEILSQELKRTIRHQPISFDEFYDALRSVTDANYARIVTDIAQETFDGRNEATSPDVELMLGRPPTDFATFARRAVEAGAWSQ